MKKGEDKKTKPLGGMTGNPLQYAFEHPEEVKGKFSVVMSVSSEPKWAFGGEKEK